MEMINLQDYIKELYKIVLTLELLPPLSAPFLPQPFSLIKAKKKFCLVNKKIP